MSIKLPSRSRSHPVGIGQERRCCPRTIKRHASWSMRLLCDILDDVGGRMKVEDEYLDVLQNIEFAIMRVFRADRSLLDLDAKDAVAALIRHYRAEQEQGAPRIFVLGDAVRSLRSSGGRPLGNPYYGARFPAFPRAASFTPKQEECIMFLCRKKAKEHLHEVSSHQ